MSIYNKIATNYVCTSADVNNSACNVLTTTGVYHRSQWLPVAYLALAAIVVALVWYIWCRWGLQVWSTHKQKMAQINADEKKQMNIHEESMKQMDVMRQTTYNAWPMGPATGTRQVQD